jgi:hypothetical protein
MDECMSSLVQMGRPDGSGYPRFDELMKRYVAGGKALDARAD